MGCRRGASWALAAPFRGEVGGGGDEGPDAAAPFKGEEILDANRKTPASLGPSSDGISFTAKGARPTFKLSSTVTANSTGIGGPDRGSGLTWIEGAVSSSAAISTGTGGPRRGSGSPWIEGAGSSGVMSSSDCCKIECAREGVSAGVSAQSDPFFSSSEDSSPVA